MDVALLIISIAVVLCASFTPGLAQNCKREPRCKITRVHGYKGADCYQRDVRSFPQCLPSDVEVIDLSLNRIRKITQDDLKKYSSLKALYLADNVVTSIDEDVFASLDSLTALDLSLNAISKLPPVVFHLPSLKSLYLGQNLNMNIVDTVQKAKPLTSPLIHFDISHIMVEEPNELPDLGLMPYLVKYNISGNQVLDLSAGHFAGLCSLQILDTTNVTAEYTKLCECWTINRWLAERKIKFIPFKCAIDAAECYDQVSPADLKTYADCKQQIDVIIHKSRMLKIFVPIGVIAGLALIAIAFFANRRRKQRMSKLRNKAPPQTEGQMLI